jgi:hypothetical protein
MYGIIRSRNLKGNKDYPYLPDWAKNDSRYLIKVNSGFSSFGTSSNGPEIVYHQCEFLYLFENYINKMISKFNSIDFPQLIGFFKKTKYIKIKKKFKIGIDVGLN